MGFWDGGSSLGSKGGGFWSGYKEDPNYGVTPPPPVDDHTVQKYRDFLSTTKQDERNLFLSHLADKANKGDQRSAYLAQNLQDLAKGSGTRYNTSLAGKISAFDNGVKNVGRSLLTSTVDSGTASDTQGRASDPVFSNGKWIDRQTGKPIVTKGKNQAVPGVNKGDVVIDAVTSKVGLKGGGKGLMGLIRGGTKTAAEGVKAGAGATAKRILKTGNEVGVLGGTYNGADALRSQNRQGKSAGQIAKDVAIQTGEGYAGGFALGAGGKSLGETARVSQDMKAGNAFISKLKNQATQSRAAQLARGDQFMQDNHSTAPRLNAPVETAAPKGLPAARNANRTPGGAVLVDEHSPEAQIVANAGKPGKVQTNPGRPGQNVTDLFAPKASASSEQVAAAGRKIADKNGYTPTTPQPKAKTNLNDLMQKWSNVRAGNASRISHIKVLNDIIEHPEASQAVKDQAMAERDTLTAKGMQDRLAAEHSIETGQPVASSHETLAAGHTPRGAVYQDVQSIINEREAQATKPVPKAEETPAPTEPPKKGMTETATSKVAGKTGKQGLFNPQRAAAREGNVDLANVAHENVTNKNLHAFNAGEDAKAYEAQRLKEGLTDQQVIDLIESGRAGESKAATMFKQHLDEVGQQGVEHGTLKGTRENYVPRIGKFEGTNRGGSDAFGLSKSHRFNNERQTIETLDENGKVIKTDKYETHADFRRAVEKMGGKVETSTAKMLERTLRVQRQAIENAKTVATLEKTPMRDGRPAVIKAGEGDGPKFKDYQAIHGMPGRLVHPEAKRLLEAISEGGALNNDFARGIARTNSIGKRLVTLNGLVHGRNFLLASMRNQGIIRTLISPFRNYSADDVRRAIANGFEPSKVSSSSLFDEFGKPKPRLGKLGEVLGSIRNKSDRILFEHFGDSVGMSTYLHIEKRLVEQGLSKEEAGKVAGEFANQTIFAIPKDQQSIAMRQTSQLALFAGKYLQNTMKIGTNALGTGIDKTLSTEAQRATQRLAVESAVRGMAYLFVTAQAINYRATGRFTWQNKGTKLEPVFWVDKTTGKEYHITNFYGQLGEFIKLFDNPVKEMTNKLGPGAKEVAQQVSNYDQFKQQNIADPTASGLTQTMQRVIHAADTLFTPLGFQASTTNKIVGAGRQPAAVTVAKLMGYGSSANDRNKLETDVYNSYVKTLPAGSSPTAAEQQLYKDEAAARHDLAGGKTSSPAIDRVKGQMSPEQFKTFMKTGSLNDTQRQFDKLPDDTKLQLIEKHDAKDLKEIDFSSLAKALLTNRSAIDSLKQKGYTAEELKADLQKVGVGSDQYSKILKAAKDQQKASAKASAQNRKTNGKWKSPLLQ